MAEAVPYKSIGQYTVKLHRDCILGRGSFGVVYRAVDGNGVDVAAKKIDLHAIEAEPLYKGVHNSEILPFMKSLKHCNIIQMLHVAHIETELWIVMEYCPFNLYSYLQSQMVTDDSCIMLVVQCASAIKYMHDKQVIHRDLKPNNVLVKIILSTPVAKIADFSFAKDVDDAESSSMSTVRGNTDWMAPELLREDGRRAENISFKRSIDLCSLGFIFTFICTSQEGRDSFKNQCYGLQIKQGINILDAFFTSKWRSTVLREKMEPLISQLLSKYPDNRPKAGGTLHILKAQFPDIVSQLGEFFEFIEAGQRQASELQGPSSKLDISPATSVDTVKYQPQGGGEEDHATPYVTRLGGMDVDFEAHWYTGVGRDNTILFGKKDAGIMWKVLGRDTTIALFRFIDNEYRLLWDRVCPTGVDISHVKLIYPGKNSNARKIIVRSLAGTDPTCMYSSSLVEENRQTVGIGKLLDVLYDGRICYSKEARRMQGQKQTTVVDIYSDITASEASLQLWPPQGQILGDGLSLSCCAETGWFALSEWDNRTLDIYKEDGTHIQRERLLYNPADVAAASKGIVVGQWGMAPRLQIYSWTGHHLSTVDLSQHGVGGHMKVYCVASSDGDVIHVFVGLNKKVKSVHALQLHGVSADI